VYEKPPSIKEHKNVLELQEATRSEVVVGEVGTTTFEVIAATPFAMHVAMQ
jgi:hypothetical protein